MDDGHFDTLVRRLALMPRRRALLGLLAGATLSALGPAPASQAKRRRKTRGAQVRNDPPNDPPPPPVSTTTTTTTTTPAPACQPDCFSKNKQCGDNGCGGSCGSCRPPLTCGGDGVPFKCGSYTCTPQCENKECGPDGCGDSCGSCEGGASCIEVTGQCVGAEKGKCGSKKARQRGQKNAETCEHGTDVDCFDRYEGNLALALACALDLAKCCALYARCLPTACSCLNNASEAYGFPGLFC